MGGTSEHCACSWPDEYQNPHRSSNREVMGCCLRAWELEPTLPLMNFKCMRTRTSNEFLSRSQENKPILHAKFFLIFLFLLLFPTSSLPSFVYFIYLICNWQKSFNIIYQPTWRSMATNGYLSFFLFFSY